MKSQRFKRATSMLVFAVVAALVCGGCNYFFYTSDSEPALLELVAAHTTNNDFAISKYLGPGQLNQGALTDSICIANNFSGVDDRLLVWDDSSSSYIDISDGAEAQADAIEQIQTNGYITIRPSVPIADVDLSWELPDSQTPRLCLDIDDFETGTFLPETIYQITVNYVYDGHTIWKISDDYMKEERYFYVRLGNSSDITDPELSDTNFECDETGTTYTYQIGFEPKLYFSERMGAMYVGVVDENENVYPMINSGYQYSGGSYIYTFSPGQDVDFEYSTLYYLFVIDRLDTSGKWGRSNMTLSQDLSGNDINVTDTGWTGPEDMVNLWSLRGTTNVEGIHKCFHTEASP